MRQAFVETLGTIAKNDKRVMLLTGDLGYRVLEPFRDRFPDRFVNVGVAEANLITVACGLASVGYIPFVYSIATFLTMRPYEEIRDDVSLQNRHVVLVGVGAGLAYTKAGPTHHATEDIALMRTLPNMTIVAPTDQQDVRHIIPQLIAHNGPSYLRIERNPALPGTGIMQLGKGRIYQKGSEIALLVTGTKIGLATEVSKQLEKHGIKPSVFLFPTIQPLDTPLIARIAKTHRLIATIEEHRTDGGFGSAVLEYVSGMQIKEKPVIIRFGLNNAFASKSGNYELLCKDFGFTSERLGRMLYSRLKKRD